MNIDGVPEGFELVEEPTVEEDTLQTQVDVPEGFELFTESDDVVISDEPDDVISERLNLKPDAKGLYNIRINDKEGKLLRPFMAGEPSIMRAQFKEQVGKVGGKANKDEVQKMIDVMDSLQKEAYSNLSKYDIVEQGTLGAETYDLTVEDNRKIKDAIYGDFKSKTGLDVDRGSFDYIYNALEQSNKNKVEQEYKLNRIRPESTVLNKDFENEFAIQADKGKSKTQLKVEALKEKQADITFKITDIDNKIKKVNNNQEITSDQREAQLDDLEDNKKILLQENKNLDSEINTLATTTQYDTQRVAGDVGSFRPKVISYEKTNKELTADFFNEQGRSEETVKRLSKLAEDTENTAGVKVQNILNTNPGISQREAIKELYEDELLYLQQFEADGRNKFINLKFSKAQLFGGNPTGSKVLKKLRDNNIPIDENGNAEVSLNQLRSLGIDSRDFEGYFDSLAKMVNDKDLKAIKSYNEEIDEVSTIAKSYRNLWRNNVDVGAIEKPSTADFFFQSAAKATLGYVGFNEKEADDFITGGKGTARTRINDLDTAIKVANQTEEVRQSMGGKIDLTDKQKENIKVSLSEEVATGIGTFVPDLVILGATGGTMNALGYAKLMSKLSPMARFVTGALVEEAKMQIILDMKPGGGATFYTLGQATAGLTPFKKRFAWLDPIFQKVIKAGPVGAISAEGAQISELAYESLIGDKNFNTEFEELYKDFDTVARRAIVNSMVFGATGFTHVKRGDFMSTRRKYEVVADLQAKVNELMGLPKETATSIEASGGVTIPDALKPKKSFEDLTPKQQKQFMEYSKRIQVLNQQIQVETMYHKLDPNSKNFEKDFDRMITQPMNRGIKAVIPEFEGVKVKFGSGEEFRKQNFGTNDKGQDLGNTAEYNPKTKEMFFDLDYYTAGKPVHEFTHAAINAYFDANPNAKRNFTKRMGDIFKDFDFGKYDGTELAAKIKESYNIDLRTWKGRNLAAEEYLAFMSEFLADPKLYYTDTNLASSLMNEFRLEVKDVLIESGIEKFAPTPKTAKDMVQLLALLGKSTRMGTKLDVKIGTLAKLDEIDILGTRLIEGNREAVTQETRASKEIVNENENIVNRLKEAKEKGDTQAETDAKNDLLINNQGLINEFVNTKFVPDLGISKEDFRSGVQLHVLDKVNKTYNPEANPEYGAYLRQVLFGGGNFGGGRLGNILKELGQQGDLFTKSTEDVTVQKELKTTTDEPTETEVSKKKAIVVSDRLKGLSDKTVAKVKSKLTTKALKGEKELGPITGAEIKDFLEKQTYKSLKDLASEETQLMFGIEPKPGNLTKSDIKNAQIFINKDPDLFISLLPKQHTTKRVKTNKKDSQGNFIYETRPDKATGVQNVLLDAFYNKGTRKDNLTPYTKKSNIKINDFLEVMGITERGKPNLYRKDSNVSARIKALVEQTGRIITNQTVREVFPNLPSTVAEGKSPILASKELTTGLERAYDEIVKTGALDKKRILKSLTIPWEREAIENLNIRRFKSAIELGFIKRQDLKKLTELDLVRDAQFFNNLTIENIAEREGETMSTIVDRYMGEEISSITDGKKLKASIPGTTYRSAKERGTIENFKKAKPYYQDLIQRLIPEGYLFSQLPEPYQKMIMTTIGFGDGSRSSGSGKTNGRPFTYKEYAKELQGKENNYINLLEAVYGVKEANLKGKGPSIESFSRDINIPAPGSSKTKASDAEIKSSNIVDFKAEAAKAILGKGQFNVDVVLDANKAALQNIFNALKDVVKEAKNPTEALDHMIDLILDQTNRSIGGIKGLAGVESITMEGMRGSNPELTKELHNEHLTELFSMNKDYAKMMERWIKGEQSDASVDLQLKRMVEDYNQGIISEARREIKDFDGNSKRSYIDNLIFLGEDAAKQIPIRESTFAEAENMAEVIRNNATRTILDRIAQTPYRKLTLAGVLVKQRQMNKAEYQKIKNENIAEAKEYDVYASKNLSESQNLNNISNRDKANEEARKKGRTTKKIRVFDFDDTLARSNNIVTARKDGKEIKLNAEDFAKRGLQLKEQGWEMDFSDFNKVTEGSRGPLFKVAERIRDARGNEDLFVLTARAPESRDAIYDFLKAEGLEFKRENIIGLGNSTGEAKANWLTEKAAEGYNDFYFADDAPQNVKAVRDALSVYDVKSKVQQAYASKDLSKDFNNIIEQTTGVEAYKEYSAAKAKVIGANKGKFKFWIPYSAEDFQGLIYKTLSKGKLGDQQMAWYKGNVLNPYARAMDNLSRDRVQLMSDFKALKKQLDVPKDLRKQNDSGFTNEQAVRVYLYNKMGHEVPGLSKTDLRELIDIVNSDGKLKAFADQILTVTKGDGYVKPGENWLVGTITTDLIDLLNTTKRKKYLQEWQTNVDQIYSKENLNKLEAVYGPKYREALENSLLRMKSGKNRLMTGSRLSNQMLDYINGSNAAIMFFNTRSAILQTISAANFINWSFNNPYQAGKAFANQKQYWKDFTKLMNSNYLLDRRNGLKLNIAESEIADAAATSKNKVKGAIKYILQKGYLPTQYADSFAIASGGATWYRNRINDLVKKGVKLNEAEQQAIREWRQIAEESQQSSDPSKISQQQASDAGRLILMFANTPMQYARLTKRAYQDLVNRRGDAKSNVSKIIYYTFVQNMIFNALQQAMFKLGFDDEADDEEKNKTYFRTANGMLDSQLRGLGIAGATASVAKNFLLDIYERSGRKRPEYVDSIYKLLQFSPPIGSKISRLRQAAYAFDSKKRRQEIFDKGFSLDNPALMAGAKTISATANVPLDRVLQKYYNLEASMSDEADWWQTLFMIGGWPEWSIMDDKKSTTIKTTSTRSKSSSRKSRSRRKAR